MRPPHLPPAGIEDFKRGKNPGDLYTKWDSWVRDQMATDPMKPAPAWYDPSNPPSPAPPAERAPPWVGFPRLALLLNNNDTLAAAQTVENPFEFGRGEDGLHVSEAPFLDENGKATYLGFKYRPQDEYLEWASQRDADGVIREIWFTCEGPEYWSMIADNDWDLLVELYSECLGIPRTAIDDTKLRFPQRLTRVESFSGSSEARVFKASAYNPYNEYNIAGAVHLTQGANTLGAEINLAMEASRIWGDPPRTNDPELICCASYGSPNRFSDPTIGKEVNDLARRGMFVALRNPLGLYIASFKGDGFTDWNDQPLRNISTYFAAQRKSPDGTMVLRANFKVPAGVKRNGVQARVGDLKYQNQSIVTGGQVASAITMHLFAQALPGAPAQVGKTCRYHPCSAPGHPGVILPRPIGTPCPTVLTAPLREYLSVTPPEAVGANHGGVKEGTSGRISLRVPREG